MVLVIILQSTHKRETGLHLAMLVSSGGVLVISKIIAVFIDFAIFFFFKEYVID